MKITTIKEAETACRIIKKVGPECVLLKGGHLPGDMVTDLFYDGKHIHSFTLPRIPRKKAHGSGCTLSALITGLLALEKPPVTAVETAKHIVWGMINEGYSPGKGSDVLNHSATIPIPPRVRDEHRFHVWLQLKTAIEILGNFLPPQYIPEVGMNFAYGLPNAKTQHDVCAIDGAFCTVLVDWSSGQGTVTGRRGIRADPESRLGGVLLRVLGRRGGNRGACRQEHCGGEDRKAMFRHVCWRLSFREEARGVAQVGLHGLGLRLRASRGATIGQIARAPARPAAAAPLEGKVAVQVGAAVVGVGAVIVVRVLAPGEPGLGLFAAGFANAEAPDEAAVLKTYADIAEAMFGDAVA